jgi:hypothetical protein
MDTHASRPNAKRKRLSHACTRCRSKKVRCDELEPNCTNCVRANVACVTFDPRTLTAARRREAQSQPAEASPSASSYGYAVTASHDEAARQSPAQHDLVTADDEAESPAVSSPLLPVLPRFLNGNSLSVLTQWLDLAFARLGMTQRLHSTYKMIRASEKRPSYAGLTLRADDVLPSQPKVASAFSATMGWLFPISAGSIEDSAPATIHPSPLHALMYAVNLAADVSDSARALSERCFGYAFNRLPAILEETGDQALDSIRALVLMSVYLRWRDDVERAWQILSLAIASVHNQSLHREHSRTPLAGTQDLFWSVFVLDKLLSIELERKPMLTSAECNRTTPTASNGHDGSMFRAVVDLSMLQDEILEKLQSSRRREEEAHASQNPTVLRQVVQDKLRLVGELDQKLLRFADGLPHGLRPTDYLYADSDSLPGLTFLAVQYYQAVFLVSRNALLINMQSVQSEIDKTFEGSPNLNRLRSGMNVCANAARSILNVLNHAEEAGVRSPVLTPYAPLMAMYGITIHIVRRQSPATAKVDLELQATAMNLIRNSISLQQTSSNGFVEKGSGLLQMLDRLHKFSESYISRSTQPGTAANATSTLNNTSSAPTNAEQWRPHDMSTRVISPPQSPANQLPHTSGALPIGAMLNDIDGATSAPAYYGSTMPLPDLNNDWFMDMGNDAMAIDWDELALTLGLPTEWR